MPRRRTRPRYRIVETALWRQSSFSTLPDHAKLLFLFLRTGPQTTLVPGLIAIGKRSLAEQLGWPLSKCQKAFSTLERRGMVQADWDAGVVFVPSVIQIDPPDNQSVITGWKPIWPEIPECPLKAKASESYRSFCERRGPAFIEAFIEATGCTMPPDREHGDAHGGGDGVTHHGPNRAPHQEQEQDQEQDIAPSALNIDGLDGREDEDGLECLQGIGTTRVKQRATVTQARQVIRTLYAEERYDQEGGQTDLSEDLKRCLARKGLAYDPDTIRKALDAEEFVEQRGLRKAPA